MFTRVSFIFKRLLTTHVAWPIVLALALLAAASILALRLAAPALIATQERNWAVGAALLLLVLVPHFHALGRFAYAAMILVTALLLAVFWAEPVVFTHRWFVLPTGIQVQPSELAKITYVLALAWYLRYRKNTREITALAGPVLLTLVPFALILKEPDLGTALLFPLTLYSMLLAAGARLRHLLAIAVLAVFLVPAAYPFLQPYQQDRIKAFVRPVVVWVHNSWAPQNPWPTTPRRRDLQKQDYQIRQSLIAIGSGGTTGQGLAGSEQIAQGLLPEAHTDFIFAVVCNQWGLRGALAVVLAYLIFLAAAVEVAATARDPFGRLLVIGLATMTVSQALINVAMATGLLPVVGIALPFVSYGGSALVANLVGVGVILNVSMRRGGRGKLKREI